MTILSYEALNRRCLFDRDLTDILCHRLEIEKPVGPPTYPHFNKPLVDLISQYYDERRGDEGYDGGTGHQFLEPMSYEAHTFEEIAFVIDLGTVLEVEFCDNLLRRMMPLADTFRKQLFIFTHSECGSDIENWAVNELKKSGTFEDWAVAYHYPPEDVDQHYFDLALDAMTEILKREQESSATRLLGDDQAGEEYHVSP